MSYTQKYCLVAFIEPVNAGTTFHMSDWPLHITLADVFAIDRIGTRIDEKFEEVIKKHAPIEIIAKNETQLGSTNVILLDKSKELLALHMDLVNVLESNEAILNTPHFTRAGYVPHCTIQKDTLYIQRTNSF